MKNQNFLFELWTILSIIATPYFLVQYVQDHHLMLSGGRRRECKKIVEEEENAGIYDGISSKNRLNNSKNIKNTY